MGKIIRLTESELTRMIKSVIMEQTTYTDFDKTWDYQYQNGKWLTRKKINPEGNWIDISHIPDAVEKLNARYGPEIKASTIGVPKGDKAPFTKSFDYTKPKQQTPLTWSEPDAPAINTYREPSTPTTQTTKPTTSTIKSVAAPPSTFKNEYQPQKPTVKLTSKSPEPKDLPTPKPTTSLPSDVTRIVESKKTNPSFKTFNGKYYVLSKENSVMYVFNNQHQLIDQAVVGRGSVVGDFPNTSDPDSNEPGLGATTPAGSGVVSSVRHNKEYGGNVSRIKYNDTNLGSTIAIHPIYPPEFAKRNAILLNPEQVDKLMSWGCINVPQEALNRPTFGINAGDSIFIAPEPERLRGQSLWNQRLASIDQQKRNSEQFAKLDENRLITLVKKFINT